MAIDFKVKDVLHKVAAKFVPAFLPEAEKAYNLKAVHQSEPDIHAIASKAERYNAAVPAKVEFLSVMGSDGLIAEAVDEATELIDEAATRGNILTIHGYGLKIESDADKKRVAGVYFMPDEGRAVKAEVIAVNEPRTLKVLVPTSLVKGNTYTIMIFTQSSVKGHSAKFKNMRDMRSDFTLTAH